MKILIQIDCMRTASMGCCFRHVFEPGHLGASLGMEQTDTVTYNNANTKRHRDEIQVKTSDQVA